MGAVEKHTQSPTAAMLTNEQLRYIASTDFVPKALRGNLPAILACVATGRALGLPDMAALRSIHVVDGKATFSAELMVSLVRRRGHSITGSVGEGKATVVGRRGDNDDEITVTWTLDMAARAGLAGKDNWKKYPEAMLWARAVSQLCRMLFADVFAGATYTDDEAELTADELEQAELADTLGDLAVPVDTEQPDDRLAGDAAPPQLPEPEPEPAAEPESFADRIPAAAKTKRKPA